MAKKKKTRKQKALSDLRHNTTAPMRDILLSQEPKQVDESPKSALFTYELQSAKSSSTVIPKTTSLLEYHHIAGDLKKTALLTIAIMASQLALYYLMNTM